MGPAAALWVGLVAGGGRGEVAAIALAALAVAALLLSVRAPARTGSVLLHFAFLLFGVARGAGAELRLDAQRGDFHERRTTVWIEAAVSEPPSRGGVTPVATVRVRSADPLMQTGTLIRLRLPHGSPLEWGDRFRAYVEVGAPPGLRNPGGYDARRAAAARGRVLEGRTLAVTRVDSTGLRSWPRSTVARWRRGIEHILERRLSAPAREVVTPLMTGDRSALPPERRGAFQRSGLVHLLALSGLHVTWLAGVARFLMAIAGRGPVARAVAGAACSIAYLALAGPLPSLARAAFMECMRAVAQSAERELDTVQALSVTILVLLALQPGWARDAGFQLSCAATLGIVTLLPWLAASARRGRGLVLLLAVTVCAQIPAWPLLLAFFHGVSWSGVLTNVVGAPVVGVLLAAAWVGVVLEWLLPGAGSAAFRTCEWLSRLLTGVAAGGADVPHAMVPAAAGVAACVIAAGAALLCWAAGVRVPALLAPRLTVGRRRAAVLGSCLLVAGLVGGVAPVPLAPPPGRVWVLMLDVGQGQALALGFHDGWWLVDAGGRTGHFDAAESIVLPAFRTLGVRRLRTLVVTHGDMDHAGGASAVRRVMRPLRDLGDGGTPVRSGTVLRGRDAPVRVVWPPADLDAVASNDSSIVLVLDGPQRVLLPADVDSTVENALAPGQRVAVLQVGHHGAASSSGRGFLESVRPRWALVSAGRRNRFGHPDSLVLERLREVGAHVLRTDEEGALWLELAPGGVRRIEWRVSLPAPPAAAPAARPTLARPHPHC